ncbi:MAG: hypothetical protein Q9213_005259 [Squamulea squamosa]
MAAETRFLLNNEVCLVIELKAIARYDPWLEIAESAPHEYTEKMKLICDTLATSNPYIQHLTICIPCLCGLQKNESEIAEAMLLYMLGPLERLRVAHPVVFHIVHEEHDMIWEGNENFLPTKHDHDSATAVVQNLKAIFAHLVGVSLDKHEQLWKQIKALERPQYEPAKSDVEQELVELCNFLHRKPQLFKAKATFVEQYIRRLRAEESIWE